LLARSRTTAVMPVKSSVCGTLVLAMRVGRSRDQDPGADMMVAMPSAPRLRATRRARVTVSIVAAASVVTACHAGTPHRGGAAASSPSALPTLISSAGTTSGPPRRTSAPSATAVPSGPGYLAPGSDPSVLPGPILVADEGNNRAVLIDPAGQVIWQFPRPGDLPAGQTFKVPDDTFFSADGKTIIATQEEDSAVSLIDVASRTITYRYGQPGVPGAGPNRLDNPDDALLLPDGSILTADIKNCRILRIAAGTHVPAHVYGTTGICRHNPPISFGSPNGAFPLRDANLLVTEINGDWVDEMTPGGSVLWSVHPPHIAYPSDTNEVTPGTYLTVDYSTPGQIVMFDQSGRTLWRYRPTGAAELNHPSLALPLPNGDVLATDDHNDRVIVVDPRTSQVVWQYGHRGAPGSGPGYLNGPDGADLSGPASLLAQFAPSLRKAVAAAP
jgi:outer membrane protein assembly factor BamB